MIEIMLYSRKHFKTIFMKLGVNEAVVFQILTMAELIPKRLPPKYNACLSRLLFSKPYAI